MAGSRQFGALFAWLRTLTKVTSTRLSSLNVIPEGTGLCMDADIFMRNLGGPGSSEALAVLRIPNVVIRQKELLEILRRWRYLKVLEFHLGNFGALVSVHVS